MLWAQHGGRAARLQESRAEAGVVAAPRTVVQRTAVQDDCAERPRGNKVGYNPFAPKNGLLSISLVTLNP